MTLDLKTLENLILQGIPEARVRIEDLRGDGSPHYAAYVTSPAFAGKSLVQQHQMIYAALGDHINTEVESFTLQTALPGK